MDEEEAAALDSADKETHPLLLRSVLEEHEGTGRVVEYP